MYKKLKMVVKIETHTLVFLTLFLLGLSFSKPAAANDNRADADSVFQQANRLYLLNSDSAILLFTKAYHQYSAMDYKKYEMVCLSRLANLYDDKGNIDTALVLSYKAVSIGLENGYDTVLAETYLRIGNLYKAAHDYNQARAFYYKVIELNMPNTSNGAWASLGILYSNIEEYDSAYFFLNKSYKFFQSLDTSLVTVLYNISSIAGSLGINSFDRGRPKEGLAYILESLRISRKIGNQSNIVSNLLNLSIAYDMQKMYNNSEEVLKEAYDIVDSIQNPRLRSRVFLLMSDHYYEVGNYKQAYDYLNKYHVLNDRLSKVDYENSLHKNELKYLKQINRIELKEVELKKERAQLQFILVFGASVLVFIFITFILFRKVKIRTKEKKKLEIESKDLDLRLKLANKRLLEMEHRIENQSIEIYRKQEQSLELGKHNMEEVALELENRKIILGEDWETYREIFNVLHPEFLKRIIKEFSNLTEGDKRQLIMLKLEYNRNKSASILGISRESVKRAQQRLANKLKLKDIRELARFVSEVES